MKTLIGFLLVLTSALFYIFNISSTFKTEILKQKEDFRSVYSGIIKKTYNHWDHTSIECGNGIIHDVSNLYRADTKQGVYIFFPKYGTITDSGGNILQELNSFSSWYSFYSSPLCVNKLKEIYPYKFEGFSITESGVYQEKLYLGKTFYSNTGSILPN